jgi:ribose transport system ATP-binding protein
MTSTAPAIEAANVRKAFGATVALDGASFSVQRGTVHALLGENGAGKSTIVKMLSGLVRPDSGDICIFGEHCDIRNPRAAYQLGIQTAFQEMTQIRDLTVVQNLLLPFEPVTALGTIRLRKAEETVHDHLSAIGLGYIDPRRELRDLDLPIRQKIEIARALYRKPRILLLDEPTSSLSGYDIDWLGDLIARVKAEGVTIIFISHRMAEVRLFCDVLTVLRNGRDIGTQSVDKVSDQEVVRMIVGRSLASTFPAREDATDRSAPPALVGTHLSAGERLLDATFSLTRGEILGVAGLQGMGQAELFQASFGVIPLRSGTIEVDGRQVTLVTPRDATRASVGLGFVPEDRKTEALCLHLSGKQNITLPVLGRFTRLGFLRERAEADAVQHVLDVVRVNPRALFTRVSAFSGGNQQKIAIAKWLLAESRTLLMYDPTRGVDVGTKYELYGLMRNFTKRGGSILFYSTEIEELVNLCDRVTVMYGGRMSGELVGGAITEESILRLALGVAADVPLTRMS